MGVIQNSINQLFGSAALLYRLSPQYENMREGARIKSAAQSAYSGLQDIEENANLDKFENYSDTQLADVHRRIGEHNKAINDLRTAEEDPRLKKYVEGHGIPHGSGYRDTLKNIEGKIKSTLSTRGPSREEVLNDLEERARQDIIGEEMRNEFRKKVASGKDILDGWRDDE